MFKFTVCLSGGTNIHLEGRPTDPAYTIKMKIRDLEGIPCSDQVLYFNGSPMFHDSTLAENEITTGSIVYMLFEVRGNGCASIPQEDPGTGEINSLLPMSVSLNGDSDYGESVASIIKGKKVFSFSDEQGPLPFIPLTEGATSVRFLRPIRGPLNVLGTYFRVVSRPVSIVNKLSGREIAKVELDPSVNAETWVSSASLYSIPSQLFISPRLIGGIEVQRASGAWKAIVTDDDLFHISNTSRIRLITRVSILRVYKGAIRESHLTHSHSLAAQLGTTGSVYLSLSGPEHATTKHAGVYEVATEAEARSIMADGVLILTTPPANVLPLSALNIRPLPRIAPVSYIPNHHDLRERVWGDAAAPDTAAFFKEYGWAIVKQSGLPQVPRTLFRDTHAVKRSNAMDPDDRTWGWHSMPIEGKEILKVRDVPSFKTGYSSETGFTSTTLLSNYYGTTNAIGLNIASKLLLSLGFTQAKFKKAFIRDSKDASVPLAEEPFTSFFEAFKYSGKPLGCTINGGGDGYDGGCFVPCEAHCDIGCITITTASSIGQGLQLLHKGAWIDAEELLVAAGREDHALVFAGEVLHYMTNSQVPKVQHRVVMEYGSLPRHSYIFEVLPLPSAIVPRLKSAPKDQKLTGRDVFVMQSMGRSSVNWNA